MEELPLQRPQCSRHSQPRRAFSPLRACALFIGVMVCCALLVYHLWFMPRFNPMICGRPRMHALHNAFDMYRADHDGRFPLKDTWCDAFLPYRRRDQLECPSGGYYAYNANLPSAHRDWLDDPDETVAFFDSTGAWNSSGGPELADPRHNGGLYVSFVEGRHKWVSPEELHDLIWAPEEGEAWLRDDLPHEPE